MIASVIRTEDFIVPIVSIKIKMLSKLCKENNPEACMDCLSIKCSCTCHSKSEEKEFYENTFQEEFD